MTNAKRLHTLKSDILLILALLISVLFAHAAIAAPLTKSSYKYRPGLGANSPALDVYSTSSNQNAPVLIYVHGGAWVTGKRSAVHNMPAHFSELGYVFVSLDYRLVPRVRVENQLDDIDMALAWISRNISQLGGDARNLHLMGHSAGAHLVTMTALDPGNQSKRLIANGALRSVVSNDTRAYDIPRIAVEARDGELPKLFADVFGTDPTRWRELSPTYQISRRPTPAFLLLFSGQGRANGRSEFAKDFASRLEATGVDVSLFDGSGYSHREINAGIGKARDITEAIDNFLARNSGG